jgi:hypothetical protein
VIAGDSSMPLMSPRTNRSAVVLITTPIVIVRRWQGLHAMTLPRYPDCSAMRRFAPVFPTSHAGCCSKPGTVEWDTSADRAISLMGKVFGEFAPPWCTGLRKTESVSSGLHRRLHSLSFLKLRILAIPCQSPIKAARAKCAHVCRKLLTNAG